MLDQSTMSHNSRDASAFATAGGADADAAAPFRSALDVSSSGSDSAGDTSAQSLRELLGIRDSREYETFLQNKVSTGASSNRRFPFLHGMIDEEEHGNMHININANDSYSRSESEGGSPSPLRYRYSRPALSSTKPPQQQQIQSEGPEPLTLKMSPMSALRASLSGMHASTSNSNKKQPVGGGDDFSFDVSADSSDDEEAEHLISEIDAMKDRLLGSVRTSLAHTRGLEVRGSPRAATLAAAAAAPVSSSLMRSSIDSTASTDSSLSYHPIESFKTAALASSSYHHDDHDDHDEEEGEEGDGRGMAHSLSAHSITNDFDVDSLGSGGQLSRGSMGADSISSSSRGGSSRATHTSEGSNNLLLHQLDSALSKALEREVRDSHSSMDMEELVEQYLSSMSASHLTAHSMSDNGSSSSSSSYHDNGSATTLSAASSHLNQHHNTSQHSMSSNSQSLSGTHSLHSTQSRTDSDIALEEGDIASV
jgi:hypothetical protein